MLARHITHFRTGSHRHVSIRALRVKGDSGSGGTDRALGVSIRGIRYRAAGAEDRRKHRPQNPDGVAGAAIPAGAIRFGELRHRRMARTGAGRFGLGWQALARESLVLVAE